MLSTLAAVEVWEGRPEAARATVARGLALIEGADEARYVLALCLAGLEAEAAIAERAAAARATAEQDEAAGVAADLLQRARATATADGIAPTRIGQGMLLTAEARGRPRARSRRGCCWRRWNRSAAAPGSSWRRHHAHPTAPRGRTRPTPASAGSA